jgi:large subunit ribosomal protein L29
MTRAKDLATMNDEELAHHLAESKEELFNLRFQLAMGKQDNSARLGRVKREVARTLTIQRQRQLGNPAGRREVRS